MHDARSIRTTQRSCNARGRSLCHWFSRRAPGALARSERKEPVRLRPQVRVRERERDIPKTDAACFAKETRRAATGSSTRRGPPPQGVAGPRARRGARMLRCAGLPNAGAARWPRRHHEPSRRPHRQPPGRTLLCLLQARAGRLPHLAAAAASPTGDRRMERGCFQPVARPGRTAGSGWPCGRWRSLSCLDRSHSTGRDGLRDGPKRPQRRAILDHCRRLNTRQMTMVGARERVMNFVDRS